MSAYANSKTCWIRGKLRLSVTRNSLYYVVCANCGMIVEAGYDWNIECSKYTVLLEMQVRISLPVTLNDENTNMRSTIKSPDADKLCPFTAAEIHKLEEEGQSVMNDISIAMDNAEVVCFVKYYDKLVGTEMLRRYVILKTYTIDELAAFTKDRTTEMSGSPMLDSGNFGVVSDEVALITPTLNKEGDSESQLFTPTTKKVLEEVSQHCVQGESSNPQPSNAKRTISFGTITNEDLENVASGTLHSEVTKHVETPKKKNKAEDNHD